MKLVLVRIDDRLIHGQIVEGWLKHINVDCILIINDEISCDPMQKVLFSMVVPPYVKVEVFAFEEGTEKIKCGYFNNSRVLILLTCPQDALRLIKSGIRVNSINIGGMHYSPGKRYILPAISVDDNDITAFLELDRWKVNLEVRLLPLDERRNIIDYIK